MYNVLGVDRNWYDLVLKVIYKLGGGKIPLIVISNYEDLIFFPWQDFYVHSTSITLCVSTIEKMILAILNPHKIVIFLFCG